MTVTTATDLWRLGAVEPARAVTSRQASARGVIKAPSTPASRPCSLQRSRRQSVS